MNVKEHILAAIRECLAKNLPASGKAILFGSQARGTAREDSDWDILIILDKEKLMADDYDNITYPLTELGWELGEEINPVMYTAQEWEKYRNTPFVRNVEKEGVRIVSFSISDAAVKTTNNGQDVLQAGKRLEVSMMIYMTRGSSDGK